MEPLTVNVEANVFSVDMRKLKYTGHNLNMRQAWPQLGSILFQMICDSDKDSTSYLSSYIPCMCVTCIFNMLASLKQMHSQKYVLAYIYAWQMTKVFCSIRFARFKMKFEYFWGKNQPQICMLLHGPNTPAQDPYEAGNPLHHSSSSSHISDFVPALSYSAST